MILNLGALALQEVTQKASDNACDLSFRSPLRFLPKILPRPTPDPTGISENHTLYLIKNLQEPFYIP